MNVIAIVGPTASGKTELADKLAVELSGEVVSADAMQVYRGMDIGTAKPLPGECTAPLHLVDIVDPAVPYSAALYQRDARAIIDRLRSQNTPAIICGGTGLYVRAALDEMAFPAGHAETEGRRTYTELADTLGPDGLHDLLRERDPESAAVIHPHNVRRTIRALEMADEGKSYARQKEGFSVPVAHYPSAWYALTMDRERLYHRINRRVDLMMERGLLDEVQRLVDAGLADTLTSRQAIGYKELIAYLQGDTTLDDAVELIKMRSRRYAKRQLSWFRRDARICWIDRDSVSLDEAGSFIRQREGV